MSLFFYLCYTYFMRYDAIVLAYGQGKRMGLDYNKVLYKVDDKTVLDKALDLFKEDDDCQKIIVVLEEKARHLISQDQKIIFCDGGDERYKSVYEALKYVKEDYVMIHDGARPDIYIEDLINIKEALKEDDACLLASKVKDTVKKVKDGYIEKTIDRSDLYLAKTPQAFKADIIKDAYDKAIKSGDIYTDDTQVLNAFYDIKIKVVESHGLNNKITYKEDLRYL